MKSDETINSILFLNKHTNLSHLCAVFQKSVSIGITLWRWAQTILSMLVFFEGGGTQKKKCHILCHDFNTMLLHLSRFNNSTLYFLMLL